MRNIKIDFKYIVSLFDVLVKRTIKGEAFNRGDYYCGITNDVERRAKEHNAEFINYVESDNKETAIAAETLLGESGYDIGKKAGNGARENSVFVYVYKKTSETIEDVPDDV